MVDISLFNRYHGKENTITNYCGLMLKLLYKYSPAKFEECIKNLTSSEEQLIVEPHFKQQEVFKEEGNKKSVADLTISQNAFKVIFEVKSSDWHYHEQFKKYIENIKCARKDGESVFFFALSNEYKDESKFTKISQDMKDKEIVFNEITFKELLESLKSVEKEVDSSVYTEFLEEFENFLKKESLLPAWEHLLEVVNCTNSIEQVKKGFYSCPNTGGPYNHNRAKYFAPYKDKKVQFIYEIDCVVIVKDSSSSKGFEVGATKYKNKKDISKAKLDERVREYFNSFPEVKNELNEHDLQIFLLSGGSETNFVKGSLGGLFGSKKYFWDISKKLDNNSSAELAGYLKNKKWEDF